MLINHYNINRQRLMVRPKNVLWGYLSRFRKKTAAKYLAKLGITDMLLPGNSQEIKPELYDLYNLHRHILLKKPKVCLEFGVGFSTIVIAHALHQNGFGKLYSVDSNQQWIDNTVKKIPTHLLKYAEIMHSEIEIGLYNGQLCHFYKKLPNITPNFVYLDGPDPNEVQGHIRGLSFGRISANSAVQHAPIAADILLYENFLPKNFTMLVDGRSLNVHFLIRNLQQEYHILTDKILEYSLFTLCRNG